MRACPKCGEAMEPGRPYCGKCGYNERFGPPPGIELVPIGGSHGARSSASEGEKTQNGEITAQARRALNGNWGLAIGTLLLYVVVTSVISAVPIIGPLAFIFINGPFTLGLKAFYLNLSRGDKADPEQIFSGFSKFGAAFGAYWLMAIFVFLWSLLLIIPGIVKAFGYAMTFMVLADDDSPSATRAIAKSQELMRGNKLKLFFLMCRFIGWGILCLLSFGIGFLWLFPYVNVSLAKFYDDVKQ